MTDDKILGALAAFIDERINAALSRAVKPANDEYLSTADAAKVARVTPGTIRRWIDAKHIRKHMAGSRIRIKRSELEAHLAGEDKATPEERARRRFG